MTIAEFEIPLERLADAESIVSKFQRKAKRLGLTPPTIQVVDRWPRRWVVDRSGAILDRVEGAGPLKSPRSAAVRTLEMVAVVVHGERPVISGWEFAAALVPTKGGTMLRKSPWFGLELPVRFREPDPKDCDHCGLRRRRNQTFVLRDARPLALQLGEERTWIQVGSKCLQDFLAAADPAAWMAVFAFVRELKTLASEFEDGLGGFGMSSPFVSTAEFLAGVAAECRLYGWQPAKSSEYCTADSVLDGLKAKPDQRKLVKDQIIDRDQEQAEAAIAWMLDRSDRSDFAHNCRVSVREGEAHYRNSRILAAGFAQFLGDDLRRREAAAAKNEHLQASPGDKVEIEVSLENVSTHAIELARTVVYSYKTILHDGEGRVIVWWASRCPNLDGVGKRFMLSGKVKKLDEWNGRKQTVVTRCKLTEVAS